MNIDDISIPIPTLIHKALTYDTLLDDIIKVYYTENDVMKYKLAKIENVNSITNIIKCEGETYNVIKIKRASEIEKKYFINNCKLPIWFKYIKINPDVDYTKVKQYRNLYYRYYIMLDYQTDKYYMPKLEVDLSDLVDPMLTDQLLKSYVDRNIVGFTKKDREDREYFTLYKLYLNLAN